MAFVEDNAFKHTYVSSQTPVIMLSTKSHEILGCIGNYDKDSININFNMNSANEISFDVYKEVDGVVEPLWDQIIDFKYIYFKQTDDSGSNVYEEFFNISLAIDDKEDTVKHITGTSACEFELSKRILYGFEINTETDYKAQETHGDIPKGGDYIPTKFYNADNQKYSLLHRVLNDKNAAVSDYEIKYVSPSLCNIQRKFTADGQSVYDFLTGTVAKEIECLFTFDSVERGIYVYDLKFVCGQCGKRGDPAAVCPHCGSTNYHSVFGEDTNIFVSAENYAESISRSAKTDNVYNCLRISGGDDIMNTALMYVNPNGSRYVYSYNQDMLDDMPEALRIRIGEYNALYDSLKATYASYSEDYYDTIDEKYKLEHSMMPEVTTPTTTAQEQANQLPSSFASFGKVYVSDLPNVTNIAANTAVQGVGAVLCDSRYKVSATGTITQYTPGASTVTWTGTLYIENYGRSEDNATTSSFSVLIGNGAADSSGYAGFLEQRILKKLDRDNTTFFDIFSIDDDNTFRTELTKYGLASLKSFYQSYDTCLSVLQEMGDSTPESDIDKLDPKPYATMYLPYFNRKAMVEAEMKVRETQLYGDGGSEDLPTGGVQAEIERLEKLIAGIHDQLNFENFLNADGRNLYPIYAHYRMESTYTNANYVSTDLDTPQLLKDAQELFDIGLQEVYKASQLQFTLNCSLNDLLLDQYEATSLTVDEPTYTWKFNRFKNYADKFQIGNWLNLQSDDKVFYLRLLSLSVDYGSLENINVTFSEALQVNGIISDAKSILDQAKSMASSYDGVAHQASKGEEASNSVEDWMVNGLNAALTTLKNSNTEEITFDNNGLLGRSYDDITDSYDNRQVKLTSKVLAFTDDNWKTAKLALGNSLYAKYDEQQDRLTTNNPGYGLLAEYINGSYITGSQICGGDLYSLNYSAGNHTGSHIDLNTGYFSLAGGNIKYDGNHLSITVGANKDISEAVDTVDITYAKNMSATVPPDASSSAWQPTQPARSAGEYLWQKTVITYLSGQNPKTTIVNITGIDGAKGDQGDPGEPGEPGTPGRGISDTQVRYAISDSATDIPSSGWYDEEHMPTPTPDLPYLWTRTVLTYTDNTTSVSYQVSRQGTDGSQGTSVTSITTQYCLKTDDTSSATVVPGKGWSNSIPEYDDTCYTNDYYYWTRESILYDNSATPTYSPSADGVVDYSKTMALRISYENSHEIADIGNIEALVVQSDSGRTVAAMKLSASETSSNFTVAADNISLYGKNITLDADHIVFNTGTNGDFTASNGTIGGWEITQKDIRQKYGSVSDQIRLSSQSFARMINGTTRTGLRIALGKKFAVDVLGNMYCKNGVFNGTVTAKEGNIGGWSIKTTQSSGSGEDEEEILTAGAIYNGADSMTSSTTGTYIGTDGIRQNKSATNYLTISGAEFGSFVNSNNYITINGAEFSSYYNSSSDADTNNYITIQGGAFEAHPVSGSSYIRIANSALRFIGTGSIRVGQNSSSTSSVFDFSKGSTYAYASVSSTGILKIENNQRLRFTHSNIQNQYVVYATNTGGSGEGDGEGRYLTTYNSITISELQCLRDINVNVAATLTSLQAQIDSLDPSSATLTANRVLISDANGKITASDFSSKLFAVCAPHATHGATNNLFNERGRVLLSADSSYGSTNNGRIVTSDITIAELDCLDGVSSNIQTQLNGKASSSTVSTLSTNLSSLTSTVNNLSASDVGAVPTSRKVNGYSLSSNVTLGVSDISSQIPLGAPAKITNNLFNDGNRVVYTGNTGYLMTSSVTGTELGYLSGVTSNIQTQLDSKISSTNGAISTVVSSNLTSNRALISNGSGKIAVSSVTSTELGYLSGLTKKITSLTASDVGAVPTSRTVNGHALSSNVTVTASDLGLDTVGTYKSATGSNTSISTSTATSVCSITLGKGTWVIVGKVRIPLISDGTLFQAGIGTSISDTYLFNCINGGNKIGVCEVLDLSSSSNTVYLIAYHNRSSSITTTGSSTWLHAVRIK